MKDQHVVVECLSLNSEHTQGSEEAAPLVERCIFMPALPLLHVEKVSCIRYSGLRVEFSNGVVMDVDLSAELTGEVFEALRDQEFFRQVRISKETRTIEWPNGADFAPEFLYEIGKEVKLIAKPLRQDDEEDGSQD